MENHERDIRDMLVDGARAIAAVCQITGAVRTRFRLATMVLAAIVFALSSQVVRAACKPAAVQTPPTSTSVCPGASAVFTVVPSGNSTLPISYQWRKNGVAISGATTNTYTIASAGASDVASYTVVLTNACGTDTSTVATLTLNPVTAATALTNTTVCPGQPALFSTTASGTGPFTYVWKKNGIVQSSTSSSLSIASASSTDAGTYTVEVTGGCTSVTNSATLTLNTATSATALSNQSVCETKSFSFTTTASGTGPFTYAWRLNGNPLSSTSNTWSDASAALTDAGTYTVVVSGNCNSVTNSAVLTVNPATSATALTSQAVCLGQPVSFSTVASGTGPFTYVWMKDGFTQPSTSNTLSIASVVTTNAGTYTVIVNGGCTSVTNTATLTVNTATSATPLSNQTVCETKSFSFTTTASGTGPFTYVWKKDGFTQPSTSNTLSIASAVTTNAGTYTVIVSGNCNSVTNSAVLTVSPATTSTSLTGLTVCPGQPAMFSTTTAGTGPFTYVWKKNGTVQSSTSSSLSIASASSTDAGTYTVEVTGGCTSVTNSATLTVNAATSATALSNQTVCETKSFSFTTTASGTGPFTYSWTLNGSPLSSTSNTWSDASAALTDAGTYTVVVSGNCNSVTNSAVLTVNPATSATALSSQVICPGQPVSFSTVASGTGPFTYVWKKNGTVQSSTSNSLSIASASSTDAGTYVVEVTGSCTSVTNTATLTVNTNTSATALTSQALCPGQTATFTTVASGSGPFTYLWKKDGVIQSSTSNSLSVASVSSADAGTYTVTVSGTCTSVTNSATLTVNTSTSATALTSLALCAGAPASFSTVASGTGPFTYVWKKDGFIQPSTSNTLSIASLVTTNAGTYTVIVTGNCNSVTNSATLTVSPGTTATALTSTTVCPGQPAVFSTTASGTGPFTYVWKKDGIVQSSTSNSLSIASAYSTDAGTYVVEVTGGCTSVTNSATLTVNTATSATALSNQTVCATKSFSFTTTASGTGPFTYVWKKDGFTQPSTSNTLSIASVVTTNAGTYTVIVTGNCNSVTNSATLTVNPATTATALTNATVTYLSSTNFTTTASGTGPFTYVWKFGTTVLSSTSNVLNIVSAQPTDAGTYTVEVTGGCTSVTNSATLTVNVPSVPGSYTLQGQSFGSTTWDAHGISGWAELQCIPTRVDITGGPATNVTIQLTFPHDNGGSPPIPGIEDLYNFSYTTNIVVVSAPILTVNTGSTWTYSLTVTVTNSAEADVNFCTRLAAGSQNYPGASLHITGTVIGGGSLGPLQIAKTAAGTGTPDLGIVKSGPAFINAGSFVTYTLSYTNSTNSTAGGVQIIDYLPVNATYVSCSGGCTGSTNNQTIVWDLGLLTNGAVGSVSYTMFVSANLVNGVQITNQATINTADTDSNTANNSSTVISTVTNGCVAATIGAQPLSAVACPGSPVTLSVGANGSSDFAYQWFKNASVISNATSSVYTIASASNSDVASYFVVVTNGCGSVTSSVVTITMNLATAASALTNLAVCPSNTAVFATTASGTGPFTYQWLKDGATLSSATNSSYTVSSSTSSDAGTYIVIVTGTCNSVTNSATLSINTAISSSGLTSITNNCSGTTAAFTETVSGSGPLTFVWKKNGTIIGGATSSSYIIPSTATTDSGTYSVEVTGPCNNITNTATLNVSTGTFGTALTSLTNCPGTSATFSTVASGAGAFSYQWQKNGGNISGATDSVYTIPSVAVADAGTYSVRIQGNCNAITNSATLSVNVPITAIGPNNATNCAGQSITLTTSVSGSGPVSYVWKQNGSTIPGATLSTYTIASAATTDSGNYTVEIAGPCNNFTNGAVVVVNSLTTASPLQSLTNCPGTSATFATSASGAGTFTYVWRKNGGAAISGQTTSSFTIPSVAGSDAGTYSVEVTGSCNTVTNTVTLSVNTATTASALSNQTNCPGDTVTFSTTASGTGPFGYVWKKDGVVQSSTSNSLTVVSITTSDAGSYTVEVTGSCNSVTNTGTLTLNTPTTVSTLTNQVVCPGQPVVFTTVASGTGPFVYVWKKDGVVQSSTSATLTIASATSTDAGSYTVEVTGACNSATNGATLTVNSPTVASALISLTNCPGQSATFSTVASGTGPFVYVWKKDGVVQSSTTDTLIVASISSTDAGTYTVEVSGNCNAVTNSATLTVNQPITSSGPNDLILCPGNTATFTTTPTGTGPFTYVWKKDGVVQSSTNNSLTIASVTNTDAGTYVVEVTGACNSVTNSATLTVNPVTIASALNNQIVCPGQSATFSTVASGTGPFAYVWKKDGVVQSSTTDTLTVTSATSADAGLYTVEVTGTCGNVTNGATLTVNAVTSATDLTNLVVCPGQSATFSTVASGTGPFSYVWKKDGVVQSSTTNFLTVVSASSTDAGSYTVEVTGACTSVTNTAMLAVNDSTGATGPSDLTLCPGSVATFTTTASGTGPFVYVWKKDGVVQSNTNDTLTVASVAASDGGVYTVEVTGTCNSVTNSATLTVNTPTTASALTDIVTCGQSATFSTVASGTGPFSYIWRKDGVVQGSTSNSLTIPSVASGDAGTYTVEVYGLCNSITNSATLTLNADTAATPLNNLILCPGQSATFSTVASGSGPFAYVWKKDGVVQSSTTNYLTIASVTSGDAGNYTVEVTGACNGVTNSATLTVNTPTTSSPLTSEVVCPTQSATFTTITSGTGPFTYVWKKDGVVQASTNNSLTIASATASDAGSYTVEVSGACNIVTNAATLTVNENTSATSLTNLVLCPNETATFTTTVSGTGPFACVWKKDGTVIDGQTTNTLSVTNITAADGGAYTVEVTGVCNAITNSATLTVNENVSATTLTDVVVCENQPASFATTPSGTGPFSYVWKKDGIALSGQTDSSISIASAQVSDAGTYSVEVTGVCTSVTNSATLTVNRLTATSDLVSLVLCPGKDATFSTVPSGTGPFSYVWSKDGSVISGETTDHITVSNVVAANAGTYSVHVSGTCNSVDTSATLTVNTNTDATSLTNLVLCPGESATFTTTVSGTGPFAFVWKKDGTVIDGQTTNTLTIDAVTATNAGTYTVEVTGLCNNITNSATLTVNEIVSATPLIDVIVCENQPVSFATTASGTGPFSYVWKKDGQLLSGQTDSSISIASAQLGDAGVYTVEVTGVCTSVTNSATLTVNRLTATSDLVSLVLCPGQNATFSTVASGTGPFSYVWSKDGLAISGETTDHITFSNVVAANAGTYSVHVSGTCNSVDTSATLRVNTNTDATSLTNLVLCPGDTATFSTTASGTGPFSYVWKKDGIVVDNETTNSLTITNIVATNAGSYTVEVSGLCTVVTNTATLTVNENVSATPLSDVVVCENQPASFATTASGTGPFNYVWKKDGGLLSGQTDSSISIASAQVGDAGVYTVEVTGVCTSVTNSAMLTVNRLTSTSDLVSLVLCPGQDATFSTVPSGTGPFSYVWSKDGVAISGQTTDHITISSAVAANAGTYSVHVTGTCNGVDKSATLTVNTNTSATGLTSLVLCLGQTATFSTLATGTGPFVYVWKKDGVVQSSTSNTLTVNSVASGDAGTYSVEVTGTCTSVTNSATLTVNVNTSATSLASLVLCPGQPATFTTVASGTGPFSYQWRKDGIIQSSTSNTLTVASVSSTDAGIYTVEVTGTCTSVTNAATLTVNENTSASTLTDLVLCPGQNATFTTAVTGTGPFGFVWKKDGVVIAGETTNTLTVNAVTATNAGTYTVEVTGVCTSVTNSAALAVNENVSSSSLTNLVVCQGESASFTAFPTGTGPFQFVWKHDGTVLPGETQNGLTIAAADLPDAGVYTVEVTGTCTSVTNSATLTVNTLTTTSDLTSLVLCPGATATFSTVPSGTGPFGYVWSKDGQPISGETNDHITLNNITSANAGSYSVHVTGTCNSVDKGATLVVNTNTSATGLTDLVLCPGQDATFTTVASGTGPFAYVWKKDGTVIAGQTTNTITVNAVLATNAGIYTVEVTGLCTSVTNNATLVVNTNVSASALTDVVVCEGQPAGFSTVASGTGPLTYVWKKNGSVIGGQTQSSLNFSPAQLSDAGIYTVEVTGLCTTATNSATLTVNTLTTTSDLTSLVRCPGQSAIFATVPSGTGPFSYVWSKDGQPIAGATNDNITLNNVSAADAGSYSVHVTGTCNSADKSATLVVNTNTAGTGLISLVLCPGQPATFTTIASGTGPFSYVWKKDGVVQSSTSNSLSIASVASGDAGVYAVEVTGICTSVTNLATLTVNTNTSATSLTGLVLCPSQTATFSTVASGTGPFAYVWKKDGAVIAGETTNILSVTNVIAANAGTYTVEVTGVCTSVTNSATLVVNENVSASALTDVVVCQGQPVTFSTVASGTGPLTYVWKKDGVVLPGASTNSISIASADLPNAGIYTVEVTGLCTAVTNSATLTVNSTTTSSDLVNLVVCPGQSATFSTVASGTGPFSYVWSKDGQPISGATDDHITLNNVTAANAGSYNVHVTGTCNSVDKGATLVVNTNTSATSLTDLVLCPGQDATFSTAASGTGPFAYVWKKDGTVIAGATTNAITVSSVLATNAGTYTVEVSGLCTSVTNSAMLTVNRLTAASDLVNVVLCPGQGTTFSTVATGTGPFSYVWTKDGTVIPGETIDHIILNNVTSANAGTYNVHVTGTCNSVDKSATLSVNTNTTSSALVSQVVCPNQPAVFTTIPAGTGPFGYVWKKDGIVQSSTTNTLAIASATSSDAGVYTVEVSGFCTSVTNSATLTVNTNASATPLSNLVLCPGNAAVFSTFASGTGPFTYVWRKNNTLISTETNSSLTIAAVGSTDVGTYTVEVSGLCTSVTNSATLVVNTNVSATSFSSVIVCPGSSTTFSTVATGTGPITYVWKKDGQNISGQTNSSLTISSATTNDVGNYSVEVSGACNTVTNSATLTLSTLASTTLVNITNCLNQPVTFATTASGVGPFTYVWKKNGGNISSATSSSYTIASVQSSDAGTYSVEVHNGCMTVTNVATLTVNQNTTASALIGQTRCPGQAAAFSTAVGGTGPFTFVWKKNGTVIPGQSTSALNLASVTNSDSGTYSVEVSGYCNTITNSATLNVRTNVSVSALGNLLVCNGQTATFSAVASGTAPFSYRWRKNGTVISGATTSLLTITNVTTNNAGTYSVEITGSCNTGTNTGTLAVNPPTSIAGLVDQNICIGDSATFTVTPFGGAPYTFVWRFNGSVVTGQTSNTLTVNNLAVTTNGPDVITCELYASCGSVTNTANLSVFDNSPVNGIARIGNPQSIRINDNQPATPFPSTIYVRCVPNKLKKVTVTLNSLNHQYARDIDILLVNSWGKALPLMAHCGGSNPVSGTFTFDDDATEEMPYADAISGSVYKPSDYWVNPNYASPAPAPNSTTLAELAQDDPSGTWQLFVEDDSIIDDGNMFGGWTLNLYYVDFVPAKFINSQYLTDGTFQTTLVGQDGLNYQIQSSANLVDWTAVMNTTVPGGSYTLTLPVNTNGPMKFFRAVQIP